MSDEYSAAEATAKKMGEEYGRNAAEWAIEPDRMTKGQMLATLRGIEAGDPAVLDNFREPDLSGENQGEPTPYTLASEIGIEEEFASTIICEAWEDGARDAFWHKIEETLNFHLKED